jgi:hypothetical protein
MQSSVRNANNEFFLIEFLIENKKKGHLFLS